MLRGGRIISTIGEPLTPPSFDSALELSFAHAKRDTIKDRNSIDLTEAEDIEKRWQEYTEELWMEVPDIVQEAVIKTILKNKKCKKAKGYLKRSYK